MTDNFTNNLKNDSEADLLTVIATLTAKPGLQARAREVLQTLIAPTRAEAGCINYDLHESLEHPGEFMFHETWRSAASLEEHSQAPHMKAMAKLKQEIFVGPTKITKWKRLP